MVQNFEITDKSAMTNSAHCHIIHQYIAKKN